VPVRPFSRDTIWLLPPSLDEVIGSEHPARLIGMVVDQLDRAAWATLAINPRGDPLGAPTYAPAVLLSIWLYGFVTGVRSSRKLEAACRDQLPYLWLSGWQRPDHNTLWRFYQAHRQEMRTLFKRTVRTSVRLGLIDLAVQAVDGTKMAGNAAKDRTYDATGLTKLLARLDGAIAELEAQNETGGEGPPPSLPPSLRQKQALREQVQAALAVVEAEEGPERINLTDPEAVLLKGRKGYVAGYNAQAMVSPLDPTQAGSGGLLITAAEVTTDADDHGQLIPMLEAAEETLGERAAATLADAGYHSGENLEACAAREQPVLMPEAQEKERETNPFHKDHFAYDATSDTYTCPPGATLRFVRIKRRRDQPPARLYQARGAICRACPFFGVCTTVKRGRTLEIGARDQLLDAQRGRMATSEAKRLFRQRKQLPEPTFGILKEQQAGRRFLLRGQANVAAEWSLLATAFNLRTLTRVWQNATPSRREQIREALAA
jgi:transposase